MSNKKAKILETIIKVLFYITTFLMWLFILYAGLLGITIIIKAFSIKDIFIIIGVTIFFYWILKTN